MIGVKQTRAIMASLGRTREAFPTKDFRGDGIVWECGAYPIAFPQQVGGGVHCLPFGEVMYASGLPGQ